MAGTPEYKGVEISKYAPGTEVVVNAKGEWKLAKVTAQGTLRDKKLSLDVEYPPLGTGSSSTETLVIDGRAPRIISPADVADFEDPDKGTVHVEKKNVAKDGTLEFTIKYDGQSYPGVTEEVFKLWKESASVGERFKQLKTELEHSSARRHLQFVEQNKAAEKMVAEIFTLIRDTKRFNTFDKTQIKERQKKLTELLKDAKKALDTLAHDVAQVDPNQDVEDDKQKREAESVRKTLEEGIANGEVKYKEKNRNAAIQKEQEAHAKDKKKYDDWVKAGAVPPARGNPPADPGAFVFSENNIEPVKPEQTAQIKKEVYLSFFENPNKTEFQKKVLREVEKLRKQQAKKDTITDTSEFEKTGTVVSDYKKPADKNVYLTSKYLEVSMKLLDQVLSKIEKNESGTIAEKLEKLHTRAGLLLNEIPKQADKKPHPTYATLHGNIEALHKLIAEDAKNFKSVDTAMNAGLIHSPPDPSQHGPDDFEKLGAFTINQREQHVDELERELRALMSSEEVREDIKAKKAKIDTEDEAYVPIIDVPERIMKELIKGRPEVGVAVESLFTSDLSTPSGKDTALKKFRDIFSDTEPAPDVLEKLRTYGIKNWEQFKKLWDTKFAEKALDTMHEMAKAMLKKEVSQNIGFLEKIVKFKGQIATRGILNGVLVGGSAYALTLVLSGGVSGIILAALGGMTGGAIKGKLFEWFGKKFGDRNKELQKELEESTKKKKNVVGRLVKNVMVGIDGGTLDKPDMIKMGEMPSFAAILAQSLRDTTTEANKMAKTEPEDVKKLEGNARVLYEEILSHVDTEEPDELIKNQLAQAILKMNGKGDMKAHLLTEKLDSKIKGAIDKAFGAFGGHEGWKKGALAGGMVGAAFFAYQDVARIGFGGALGAWAGFKEGSKWDTKAEQKKAREQAFEDIHALREFAKTGVAGTDAERAVLRERLMRLKRLLHVSPGASQSELAVYGIVGREVIPEKKESHGHGGGHHGHGGHGHGHGGHKKSSSKEHAHKNVGGWVDYAGNVVIDKNGNMVDPELKFLFQDMRAAVNDAEHEGLLQDKEEDRQKLDIVLNQFGKRGKDIESKEKKRGILAMFEKGAKWVWKHKYGFLGAIGGGALGATVAYGGRELFKGQLREGLSSEPLPPHDSLPRRPSMGDLRGGAAPTAIAGGAGARALESTMSPDTTLSRTSGSSGAIPPEVAKPGTEIHEQRSMYSETSTIKKGEGVLHAVDRLIKDIDTGSLPELENLKGTALHNWKIAELKRMGFVFEEGKWGYPFTVHKGAQVELYTEIVDGKTVPHLRVIGDEGKEITMHKYHRFKGEVESATTGVSPERQAQIEAAKNNVAQFSKELHASTEVGSQTAPSVLPDQEIKDRLRVGGKLPGILDAEPAFDGRAVRLTLEGGEHAYVYPHHDAELRLGTDSNQDRFFWRLKSMEHSPAFILPGEEVATTGGAGKMVDSDTVVDRRAIAENKSVMSKEEYTKYRGAPQPKVLEEVKPTVQEEKIEASEKNGTDIKTPEVESLADNSTVREMFVDEVDTIKQVIVEKMKHIGNSGNLNVSNSAYFEKFFSDLKSGSVVNPDSFVGLSGDKIHEVVVDNILTPEMRLLLEPFDNTLAHNFVDPVSNIEGRAMIISGTDAEGKMISSVRLRVSEGGQTKDFIFTTDPGYTLDATEAGIILKDSSGNPAQFQLAYQGRPATYSTLSGAELIAVSSNKASQ